MCQRYATRGVSAETRRRVFVIQVVVADYYDVDRERMLLSSGRTTIEMRACQVALWLTRVHARVSWKLIASMFNRAEHTALRAAALRLLESASNNAQLMTDMGVLGTRLRPFAPEALEQVG